MKVKLANNILEGLLKKTIVGLEKKFKDGDDGNAILTLLEGKKEIGTITLGNDEMTITGKEIEARFKVVKDEYDKRMKDKITETMIKSSVFKSYLDSGKDGKFGFVATNPVIFRDLAKRFVATNLSEIQIGDSLARVGSCFTMPTLAIEADVADNNRLDCPSGFYARLKTFLFDTFGKKRFDNKDTMPFRETKWIAPFEGEKVEEVKIDATLIGHYFRERNLIHLFFNPFSLKEILPLEDSVPEAIDAVIKALMALKITKEDTKKLKEKMFVSAFLKQTKGQLETKGRQLTEEEARTLTYQKSIIESVRKRDSIQKELDYIRTLLATDGTQMFVELDKAKKL
ncbi:MAG: hypothetical protein V1850_07260, partial [Candidatus Bathyarchaeota archaeon]